MTLETIKVNIDRKIEKMIDTESKTMPDVTERLRNVTDNFQKILDADTNSSPKNYMIQMYIDHSHKRVKDFELVQNKLSRDEYFAGCTDHMFFKLLKFRDRISADVFMEAA